MMLVAHKIALDPTPAQARYFAKASGTARFAWNWALAEWKRQYPAGEKPTAFKIDKALNAIKREQFPWMYDVTKTAPQNAILDLGEAFQGFFDGRSKYPKFKNRDSLKSFCAAVGVGTFRTDGKKIKLPVIGWVKLREEVRFSGPMKRATVSFHAGRWFVSVLIDTPDILPVNQPLDVVGVDLGVTTLATLSSGEKIEGPKAHKAALARLRRANKALARKRKGSANWRKQKARRARLHARVANIRKDAHHKLTTRLAKSYRVIGVENLTVRGMVKNGHLARSVSDGAFFEFRRQLDYKCRWYGSRLIVADRWYPSSKTCSCCGAVKTTLALAERVFRCTNCQFEADRDVNAAVNLASLAAGLAVSACGETRSGAERKPRAKRVSLKQEPASSGARNQLSKPAGEPAPPAGQKAR